MAAGFADGTSCVTCARANGPASTLRSGASAKKTRDLMIVGASLSADLHHVVEEWPADFLEPVWNAVGNDDDVTLVQGPHFPAGDGGATQLIRRRHFRFDGGSAGHEGRGAVEHIDDVRVLLMDLGHSRRLATTCVDLVVGELEQRHALRKRGLDARALDVLDALAGRHWRQIHGHLGRGSANRGGARHRDLLVTLSTRGATDTNSSDDLLAIEDRHATLKRCEVLQCGHCGT